MGFMRDEGARKYYCYLMAALTAVSVLLGVLWGFYGRLIRRTVLDHDSAVCAALLAQGVDENVAARAFARGGGRDRTPEQEDCRAEGKALLEKIGFGEETRLIDMPDILTIQRKALPLLAGLFALLWIGILAGAWIFLEARDRLYGRAVLLVERFAEGDFRVHLPRTGEGRLYELFGKIDSLANVLSARNEEILASKDFLKDTISDISHQLKTPLSALVMYNDIIDREAGDRETVLAFSGKTSAALRRIEALIQALLKITRLDAGAVAFEKQDWLLADVVSRAVEELRVRAAEEGKEIILEGDMDAGVSCDLQWTVEALGNLVKNALDYTQEGGRIVISWKNIPEITEISVCDNGRGIAEEDFYHIFKRFYRAGGSAKSSQGVGLGLPLAKSVAEGQGGTLSASGRPGEGTVFRMTLPG